jgi:photosystem II stability/assembly factor-like uncharacterized protein
MSPTRAAGRAILLAAILVIPAAGAERAAPASAGVLTQAGVPGGPLAAGTLRRLLLVDGVRAGSRIVAVGDGGTIALTDDDGSTWRRAAAPPAPLLTAVTFADAKHGWAVGHDTVILATTDGGETWALQYSAPAEQRPLLSVLFLDAQRGITVGAYGAYLETTDGGGTWNARKVIAEDKHLNAIVSLPSSASVGGVPRLLIFGEEGTILASANEGRDWKKVASPYKGSLFGAVVAGDGAVLAFGLRGKIYRSADGGETWSAVENASTASLMGGVRLPDGAIVLAGGAGTVLVSRDDGRSFGALPSGTAKALSKPLLGAPNAVMILGEGGARMLPLPLARRTAVR